MANPASTADLAARWRPLSAAETIVGGTLLDDAYGMLKRRVTDLDARVTADDDGFADVVVRVLATAVLRVMKNPDGKRSESIDDYTWQRDQAISAGVLYFTDDELADLMPVDPEDEGHGPAFSIDLLGDYAARLAE
jgi:hypothetical protein